MITSQHNIYDNSYRNGNMTVNYSLSCNINYIIEYTLTLLHCTIVISNYIQL